MAVEIHRGRSGDTIHMIVSDKLTKDDYARIIPDIESMIAEHGRIRVLFDMRDFHGWSAGALWEDMKFDVRHFRDIELLAVVGEKRWQRSMATFCKPFTAAAVRYFDREHLDQAAAWLENTRRPVHARR
jgi:hypothetical protein